MAIRTRVCGNCGAQVTRPKSRAVEFGNVNVQHRRKKSVKASYTVATRVVCKDRRACAARLKASMPEPVEQHGTGAAILPPPVGPLTAFSCNPDETNLPGVIRG